METAACWVHKATEDAEAEWHRGGFGALPTKPKSAFSCKLCVILPSLPRAPRMQWLQMRADSMPSLLALHP